MPSPQAPAQNRSSDSPVAENRRKTLVLIETLVVAALNRFIPSSSIGAIRLHSVVSPVREFLLSQHLNRGKQGDEALSVSLVAYLELLEAFLKYGISSFSGSKRGFRVWRVWTGLFHLGSESSDP
jgi:hypothetical protein